MVKCHITKKMELSEKLLGIKLTNSEYIIYNMFENNPDYYFTKDKNGNLKAVKHKKRKPKS